MNILRFSYFSLLCFALPLRISLAAEDSATQLRVLCYNIHYGQGTDGIYDVQRLAEVIKQTKPDLVALQEIDVGVQRSGRIHQLQKLSELTGLKSYFGPTQHYQGGLFGNGVLTRFTVEEVFIQPLPYTLATPEKTTYPRGAIAVVVRTPKGNSFRFVSTHFQHNVPEDRVAEAKAINSLFGINQFPTILAGDMNATPDAEPIQILGEKWINAIDEKQSPSAPSMNPRSRIDYIFYRGGQFKLVSTEVIDESKASDHRPVFAVFEFNP